MREESLDVKVLTDEEWDFGEPIHLPEPFGIEIDTGRWRPWKA